MRSVERHLLKVGLEDLYAKLRAATTPGEQYLILMQNVINGNVIYARISGEKSKIRAAIAVKTGSQVSDVRMQMQLIFRLSMSNCHCHIIKWDK